MYFILFPWRCLVAFWRWEWSSRVILAITVGSLQGSLYYFAYWLGGHNAMWYIATGFLWFNWHQANDCKVFVPSYQSYLRIIRRLYHDEIPEYECFYRITHEYWFGNILTVDGAIELPDADVIATDRVLVHGIPGDDGRVPVYYVHYRGRDYLASWN